MASETRPDAQPPILQIENIERGVGLASATYMVKAEHLNRKVMLHGAIVAGLMDVIMTTAAGCHPDPTQRRFAITLSLSLNFVSAAGPGTLRLQAETTGGGKRTCFCEGRIEDSNGNPVATAQGAFKLLEPGSE
jgi:uncharacterized protein (TIGR00369 family)